MKIIEIFGSLECPYAYLMTYRLRKLKQELKGNIHVVWRALSLEYINRNIVSRPDHDIEVAAIHHIEPDLPIGPWTGKDWGYPVTMWPGFEALACAQAQGHEAAFEMSWALRHAFFAEGRCISLRHELLAVAENVAALNMLDLEQFEADWDNGRYKSTVIAESRLGWHGLKVNGSATLLLPDGKQVTNPGIGQVKIDKGNGAVIEYIPPQQDPVEAYRKLLELG